MDNHENKYVQAAQLNALDQVRHRASTLSSAELVQLTIDIGVILKSRIDDAKVAYDAYKRAARKNAAEGA